MEHPENLSGNELNFLIGESEAFSSDDYVPFLEDLKEQDDKYGTINPRENLLMQGCLLKEQEIRNLINLGLGVCSKNLNAEMKSKLGWMPCYQNPLQERTLKSKLKRCKRNLCRFRHHITENNWETRFTQTNPISTIRII